jgi:hypothetical protein
VFTAGSLGQFTRLAPVIAPHLSILHAYAGIRIIFFRHLPIWQALGLAKVPLTGLKSTRSP